MLIKTAILSVSKLFTSRLAPQPDPQQSMLRLSIWYPGDISPTLLSTIVCIDTITQVRSLSPFAPYLSDSSERYAGLTTNMLYRNFQALSCQEHCSLVPRQSISKLFPNAKSISFQAHIILLFRRHASTPKASLLQVRQKRKHIDASHDSSRLAS